MTDKRELFGSEGFVAQIREQQAEAGKLDDAIKTNLKGLGFIAEGEA